MEIYIRQGSPEKHDECIHRKDLWTWFPYCGGLINPKSIA